MIRIKMPAMSDTIGPMLRYRFMAVTSSCSCSVFESDCQEIAIGMPATERRDEVRSCARGAETYLPRMSAEERAAAPPALMIEECARRPRGWGARADSAGLDST